MRHQRSSRLLDWHAKSGTGILAGQGFGVLYSKNRVPVLPLFFAFSRGCRSGYFFCVSPAPMPDLLFFCISLHAQAVSYYHAWGCHMSPGEPTMNCVRFALVWPHRRGIGGQGVKTWRCIHGAWYPPLSFLQSASAGCFASGWSLAQMMWERLIAVTP